MFIFSSIEQALEAARSRHSVRNYTPKPIEDEIAAKIHNDVHKVNQASGLSVQLVTDEEKAFGGRMAHYGRFSGVRNYFAMVGRKGMEESIGYYGEQLVLQAQVYGLNTCWVGLTYNKPSSVVKANPDEKLYLLIALGYGKNPGKIHHMKLPESITKTPKGNMPVWFHEGLTAALYAPTAFNQQRFSFTLQGDKVKAKAGIGFYTHIDLGIAKLHFELGTASIGKHHVNYI